MSYPQKRNPQKGRIIKPKIPLVSDAEDPGTSLTPFNVAELSSTNSRHFKN